MMPIPGPHVPFRGMSPALLSHFHSDLKAEPCPLCPPRERLPPKWRGVEMAELIRTAFRV